MDASVLRTTPTQSEQTIIAKLISDLGLNNVQKITGTDIFIGYDNHGNAYSIQILKSEGKPSRFDIKSISLTNRLFGISGLPSNIRVVETSDPANFLLLRNYLQIVS